MYKVVIERADGSEMAYDLIREETPDFHQFGGDDNPEFVTIDYGSPTRHFLARDGTPEFQPMTFNDLMANQMIRSDSQGLQEVTYATNDTGPVWVQELPVTGHSANYPIDLTAATADDDGGSSKAVSEDNYERFTGGTLLAADDTVENGGKDANKTEKDNAPATKTTASIVTTFPIAGVMYSLDSAGMARDAHGEVVASFAINKCDLSALGMAGEGQE